jgi:hypothetical protein
MNRRRRRRQDKVRSDDSGLHLFLAAADAPYFYCSALTMFRGRRPHDRFFGWKDHRAGAPQSAEKFGALRSRRTILRVLTANAVATPTILRAASGAAPAEAQRESVPAALSAGADPPPVTRCFTDPVLELVRLLRNAAEIEHAALLQFSYSAFSLKGGYESVSGYNSKDAISLLVIAIDRMKRLGVLNRMLATIGAPPHLAPPRFPFRTGAYPFSLDLEPLSREALARFIWREAPRELFDDSTGSSSDAAFVAGIRTMLGVPARGAGIYPAIVAAASEAHAAGADLPDLTRWTDVLQLLEQRGQDDRFRFLKGLFLGSDPAFAEHGDVWRPSVTDPAYPSYAIPSNPTTHLIRSSLGSDSAALTLTRLGNLQYATTLSLLDLFFRHHLPTYRSQAVAHMTGPVRSLGRYLPHLGMGLPFEAVDIADSSALDAKHRLRFVLALLHEGQAVAEGLGPRLPPDYPLTINRDTIAKLGEVGMVSDSGSATTPAAAQ